MTNQFKSLLDAVDYERKPFYFGIGGAGDFLLLLSTFYEDIERCEVDVVFVANNVKQIQQLSKRFSLVRKYWIYPMSTFSSTKNTWDIIVNRNCRGAGVTPKEFDYIGDWIECGKSNVFDYYGVKKFTSKTFIKFISRFRYETIQPIGGRDSNRISKMSREQIKDVINNNTKHTYLIGSEKDIDELGFIEGSTWINSFEDSIHKLVGTSLHHSVNSWTKTLTGLLDIPTIIYPSHYIENPQKVYGHHKDPADYVFLDNWGFMRV